MVNTEKDYYKILGITEEEKNLKQDDFNKILKKKYKKLALTYHPDRWTNKSEKEQKEAEEKFKEISEANDVLSNPDKRRQYDMGGIDMDFSDMFSGFGFNPFGSGGRQRVNKGTNVETYVFLTLKEAYQGVTKKVTVERKVSCKKCKGTGSNDGSTTVCPHCNGTGMFSERIQMGPGAFSIRQGPCKHCNATGRIVKNPCKQCNGTGLETEKSFEEYKIPRGVINGLTITVPGAGNVPANGDGINGDLLIKVIVKDDSYFKVIDGINLVHYEEIPFNECLLGTQKEFETIDGSKIKVKIPELTKHGETFIYKGKGMPHFNDNNVIGDYAIVINYKLPKSLTNEQKEKLKNF